LDADTRWLFASICLRSCSVIFASETAHNECNNPQEQNQQVKGKRQAPSVGEPLGQHQLSVRSRKEAAARSTKFSGDPRTAFAVIESAPTMTNKQIRASLCETRK